MSRASPLPFPGPTTGGRGPGGLDGWPAGDSNAKTSDRPKSGTTGDPALLTAGWPAIGMVGFPALSNFGPLEAGPPPPFSGAVAEADRSRPVELSGRRPTNQRIYAKNICRFQPPPCPAPTGLDGPPPGPSRALPSLRPDSIAGPATGFLTEPSSCRPIYLIRRVNVILTASRAVNDHDPFTCCSQGFDRERGTVHAPQARSGGPPGMQLDVDEYGSLDGLADRRPRWGPATGIGGSHDDPPIDEMGKGGVA